MTFFTQFILGSRGMPRRYYNYLDQFQPLHAFSTFGSWILGAGLFLTAAYLLATFRKPMDAPDESLGRPHARVGSAFPADHAQLRFRSGLTHGPYDLPPARPKQMKPVAQRHERRQPWASTMSHESTTTRSCSTTSPRRTAVRCRQRSGMWLFLATEILLFGGLFVGFALQQAAHPQASVEAHHHLDKRLGALNTVVLLFSSFTMVMAVRSAQNEQAEGADDRSCLITLACAAIFLVVKYFEYSPQVPRGTAARPVLLRIKGDTVPNQFIFFSFYFMMTGLHGIHVLLRHGRDHLAALRATRRAIQSARITRPVDMVGLYWHLVDLIWIYLFPLLYLIT